MGCHFLLQEIFLTQGLNLGLPHCSQLLYHLSHQGSLIKSLAMTYSTSRPSPLPKGQGAGLNIPTLMTGLHLWLSGPILRGFPKATQLT